MKIISAKFIDEDTMGFLSATYKFLCSYSNIKIRDVISTPKYKSLLIVTKVEDYSLDDNKGTTLEILHITTLNGEFFKEEPLPRVISITLEQAKEWYKGSNAALRELALSVYTEKELGPSYQHICQATDTTDLYQRIAKNSMLRLSYYCKLDMIAQYFNKGWKKTIDNIGYFIIKVPHPEGQRITIFSHSFIISPGIIYFKRKEDAKHALTLMGNTIEELF